MERVWNSECTISNEEWPASGMVGRNMPLVKIEFGDSSRSQSPEASKNHHRGFVNRGSCPQNSTLGFRRVTNVIEQDHSNRITGTNLVTEKNVWRAKAMKKLFTCLICCIFPLAGASGQILEGSYVVEYIGIKSKRVTMTEVFRHSLGSSNMAGLYRHIHQAYVFNGSTLIVHNEFLFDYRSIEAQHPYTDFATCVSRTTIPIAWGDDYFVVSKEIQTEQTYRPISARDGQWVDIHDISCGGAIHAGTYRISKKAENVSISVDGYSEELVLRQVDNPFLNYSELIPPPADD